MPRKPNLKSLFAAPAAAAMASLTGCAGMEAVAAGPMGDMAATAAGIPQTGAFLPDKSAVAPGEKMAIDGTYTISTLGKRIMIDRGRGYAVDGWTHALTLKIMPGMVTLRNIQQIDADTYQGDDLPLLGKATLTLQPDGRIDTVVAGMVPYRYSLVPAAGARPVGPPVADAGDNDDQSPPASGTEDCERVAIDPDTNELICLD